MPTINLVKKLAKSTLRKFGLDLVRANHNTNETWLSLRSVPFKCVIDVGANEGQFAKIALEAFPDAELHCFEPQPEPFTQLSKLAQDIGNSKMHCYFLGLAEEPGELEFKMHVDHTSSSSFLRSAFAMKEFCPEADKVKTTKVTVSTLDASLPKQALEQSPVLLKLDVQGYEDRVLSGAVKSLDNVDAAIVEVMFAKFYDGQARFIDIASRLSSSGLEYAGNINQVYDNDGRVLWTDCVFTRASGRGTP
jgi:FkbM family methyltransferase